MITTCQWPENFPALDNDNNIIKSSKGFQVPLYYTLNTHKSFMGIKYNKQSVTVKNFDTEEQCVQYNTYITQPQSTRSYIVEGKLNNIVVDTYTNKQYTFQTLCMAQNFNSRLNNTNVIPYTHFFRNSTQNITTHVKPELMAACSMFNVYSVTTSPVQDYTMFVDFNIPNYIVNPYNYPHTHPDYSNSITALVQYLTTTVLNIEHLIIEYIGNNHNTFDNMFTFNFYQTIKPL